MDGHFVEQEHVSVAARDTIKGVVYYSTLWALLDASCRVLVLFNTKCGIVEPYHYIKILVGVC